MNWKFGNKPFEMLKAHPELQQGIRDHAFEVNYWLKQGRYELNPSKEHVQGLWVALEWINMHQREIKKFMFGLNGLVVINTENGGQYSLHCERSEDGNLPLFWLTYELVTEEHDPLLGTFNDLALLQSLYKKLYAKHQSKNINRTLDEIIANTATKQPKLNK